MKNISKNFLAIMAVLFAMTFITNAQTNSAVVKSEQLAVQAEKFFNIQTLDNLKTAMDAAYANYKQATAEKAQELQLEFLKARRLYVSELEKTMPSYDKTSETGQKIRTELRRANTTQ
jgi:hypothetical protein